MDSLEYEFFDLFCCYCECMCVCVFAVAVAVLVHTHFLIDLLNFRVGLKCTHMRHIFFAQMEYHDCKRKTHTHTNYEYL